MTPELATSIIACLGALAAWLKNHTEVSGIQKDREATKTSRDEEAQKMRDKILILDQQLSASKQDISRLEGQVTAATGQLNQLTNQLSIVLTKMDSIIDTLKELKENSHGQN
jgi:CII-binding regulator of phage lambda lysogenization HflD